jgi:hypothetical protein
MSQVASTAELAFCATASVAPARASPLFTNRTGISTGASRWRAGFSFSWATRPSSSRSPTAGAATMQNGWRSFAGVVSYQRRH